MMLRLMRTKGLGVGISSAANVVAACQLAPRLDPDASILTFASYDGVADYLDALQEEPVADREETAGVFPRSGD